MRPALYCLAVLVLAAACRAQEPSDSLPQDTVKFHELDRLRLSAPVDDSTNFERRLVQDPTLGLFKSMALPGWGQLGNRRFVKAGIFAALDAYLVAGFIVNLGDEHDYHDLWQNAADIGNKRALYDQYQAAKDDRSAFFWYAVILRFFAMFDAYVDAHLSGYPSAERAAGRDSNLSLELAPEHSGGLRADLRLRF